METEPLVLWLSEKPARFGILLIYSKCTIPCTSLQVHTEQVFGPFYGTAEVSQCGEGELSLGPRKELIHNL